jgi:Asp-tRNA(Asn)/Glu-tRNA(Gln) amidotransferase B subunit
MPVSDETLAKYDMTIGIECHVQLATETKLFSPADNDARDAAPNTKVHAIDFGLPGMLPILNRHAVDLAIRAGKALNAPIAHVSRFDRKHYFYPDLPKALQPARHHRQNEPDRKNTQQNHKKQRRKRRAVYRFYGVYIPVLKRSQTALPRKPQLRAICGSLRR